MFTIPLSAAYFGVLSVVSPLSNLLVVPVAGWNFMAAFVTVLVGFVWLPAAKLLGLAALGLTKYMLLAARLLARLPGHALYLNNKYLIAWLVFVYVLFTAAALLRGPVKAAVSAAVGARGVYAGALRVAGDACLPHGHARRPSRWTWDRASACF